MNIFVCEGEIVKVGDLGIAKILKDGAARTQIGTPHYMSPEVSVLQLYFHHTTRAISTIFSQNHLTNDWPRHVSGIYHIFTLACAGWLH